MRRLCFHRCLSVHMGGVCLSHIPLGRHPPDRHPPWADTPLGRHPLGSTHPLGRQPPCPVHAGMHTPPAQCMLGYTLPLPSACWDTVNKRAVRIPLECILVLHVFHSFGIMFTDSKNTQIRNMDLFNLNSTVEFDVCPGYENNNLFKSIFILIH